jgi:hypothetical protein
MPDRVAQRLKLQVLNRLMDFGEGKSEFTLGSFDLDFGNRN